MTQPWKNLAGVKRDLCSEFGFRRHWVMQFTGAEQGEEYHGVQRCWMYESKTMQ